MSVAKRSWEGHIIKDSTEVGFANGSVSIDRGLQIFTQIGDYDLTARREAIREITGTIEHGFIDISLFATGALQTSLNPLTFDIAASFSADSIVLSGCSIESWDIELPQDGWITETVNFRAKTIKSYG
jgi:hypothetical protein